MPKWFDSKCGDCGYRCGSLCRKGVWAWNESTNDIGDTERFKIGEVSLRDRACPDYVHLEPDS